MHILKKEYYEVGQHIAGMGTTDFIIKSNFHNNSVLIFQADSNSAGTQVDMMSCYYQCDALTLHYQYVILGLLRTV